jgi:hypothetical protein
MKRKHVVIGWFPFSKATHPFCYLISIPILGGLKCMSCLDDIFFFFCKKLEKSFLQCLMNLGGMEFCLTTNSIFGELFF